MNAYIIIPQFVDRGNRTIFNIMLVSKDPETGALQIEADAKPVGQLRMSEDEDSDAVVDWACDD